MRAEIDIQIVWNEGRGVVQMFVGDFCIGLPPVLCEQLEKELAAARRIPERARLMVSGHLSDCDDMRAWGGDAVASDAFPPLPESYQTAARMGVGADEFAE